MNRLVKVYKDLENKEIIADVNINTNLDYWDGTKWTSGGISQHKGLTKLKDGRFVLIYSTDWKKEDDIAVLISKRDAIREILQSGNKDLLDDFDLRDIYEKEYNIEHKQPFCFRGKYAIVPVGNSLGIRLDAVQLKNSNLKRNDMIDISVYKI